MTMTPTELKSALESIIYAADEPATLEQLASVLGEEKHIVRAALDELVASYASDERGVEIRAVAGGYRVYTKPQHHDLVRRFIKSLRPPLRLTMPALETLAVIAYKQPVTQPEIQEIRGVNCAGVIETLLEKRLITTAGRKQVIGRPILYRTSKDFLMRFGLGDVDELPSLKEFEALAREALGTDDGIAAEVPEGEMDGQSGEQAVAAVENDDQAATESAPDAAATASPAGEVSGDSPETFQAAPESAQESAPQSKLDSAIAAAPEPTADQSFAAEPGDDPAKRAAKKAAPGSSD
jgi:segregation and condensation protein B